jgi:8-oxo-dGTP diphosphatase
MWITQKENKSMALPLTEVSCAIIMDGDRILVTQRSEQMPHPLKWEFPGGKLKPGETPEGCIIREIREELGVEISVIQLLPSVRHRYSDADIKLIPFVCTISQGDIDLSEHRSYSWVLRSQLEQIDWLEADIEVVALVNKYC